MNFAVMSYNMKLETLQTQKRATLHSYIVLSRTSCHYKMLNPQNYIFLHQLTSDIYQLLSS